MTDFDALKRIVKRYDLIPEDALELALETCPEDVDPVDYLKSVELLNDRQGMLLSRRLEVEAKKPESEPEPVEISLEEIPAAEIEPAATPVHKKRSTTHRKKRAPEPVEEIAEAVSLPQDKELKERSLGSILVALQLIVQDDLDEALARQEELRKLKDYILIGRLFVEKGLVDEKEIFRALRIQGKALLRCITCDLHAVVSDFSFSHRISCPACFGRLIEKDESADFPKNGYPIIDIEEQIPDPLIATQYKDFQVRSLFTNEMATNVYVGEQVSLGRRVGIRILSQELSQLNEWKELFFSFSRRSANLSFHTMAAGIDVGEIKERPCYIFEFPEGHSVEEYVIRKGPLFPNAAAKVIFQVGKALEYCHSHNVFSGILPPSHVFISTGMNVKLFGLGMNIPALVSGGMTIPAGNPAFIAPEVLSGSHPDDRSDLYSIGALFYFLLSAVSPIKGKNWLDLVASNIYLEPTPVEFFCESLPRGMAEVVGRLLRKNPEDRFRDIAEFLSVLAPFAGEKYEVPVDLDAAEVPAPLSDGKRRPRRRRRRR